MEILSIRAAQFANAAHQGMFRNNPLYGVKIPYVVHVGRVAARVTLLPGSTEDMVAAAWLHDVVEDCNIALTTIAKAFNPQVAEYVWGLTSYTKRPENRKHWKDRPRKERIGANNSAYENANVQVKRMKCCDRIDNLTDTLINSTVDFAERYTIETEDLIRWLRPDVEYSLIDQIGSLIEAITVKYNLREVRNNL